MGFRPEVENFQPYYAHNPKHMTDLRIGGAMLKEALDRMHTSAERAKNAKIGEKAEKLRASQQVRERSPS